MISAEPFTGKSLLAISMLLSVDTSRPLFGKFSTSSSHRCLFLGQDAPTWDYHGLFLKLFYGLGLTAQEEDSLSLPSLLMLNKGHSITDPDFVPFISSCISLYGITVLFLDTLLEFHPFDENSNREMKYVMQTLKKLRDSFGLTIIFTHHISKLGGSASPTVSMNYRARGASVISGSIDQHIFLGLKKDSPDPLIALSFAKGRGLSLRDNPIPYFSIQAVSRPDKKEALRLSPQDESLEEKLLSFLFVSKERSEIEEFLRNSIPDLSPHQARSRASHLLDKLKASSLISQPSHGKWIAIQGDINA